MSTSNRFFISPTSVLSKLQNYHMLPQLCYLYPKPLRPLPQQSLIKGCKLLISKSPLPWFQYVVFSLEVELPLSIDHFLPELNVICLVYIRFRLYGCIEIAKIGVYNLSLVQYLPMCQTFRHWVVTTPSIYYLRFGSAIRTVSAKIHNFSLN